MRLMAPLFGLSIILACSAPAIAGTMGTVVEDQVFGCTQMSDLTKIRALSVERKSEAVMAMVSDKRCSMLETGEKIVVDTSSLSGGDIRVRAENSHEFVWTSRNSLEIKS